MSGGWEWGRPWWPPDFYHHSYCYLYHHYYHNHDKNTTMNDYWKKNSPAAESGGSGGEGRKEELSLLPEHDFQPQLISRYFWMRMTPRFHFYVSFIFYGNDVSDPFLISMTIMKVRMMFVPIGWESGLMLLML